MKKDFTEQFNKSNYIFNKFNNKEQKDSHKILEKQKLDKY